MKETILALTLLLIQTIICFGQDSNLNSISSESNATKSCRKQVENKAIGLSNITSDTLTFQQFRHCDKISIKSILGEEITSYKLSYFLPGETDLVERTVLNDKLSEELIQSVIASGTKRLVFSEVIGAKGTENILIGYRCFYLN
jgi:hypothetical protein